MWPTNDNYIYQYKRYMLSMVNKTSARCTVVYIYTQHHIMANKCNSVRV